jgi:zinc transporter ZupT
MSPRRVRVIAITSGAVTLAGLALYGWLIYQGVNHPDSLMALDPAASEASGRGHKNSASDLAALVSVSFVWILVGVFCLGLADVARRRTRPALYTRAESNISGSGFQYPVRPIGWGWERPAAVSCPDKLGPRGRLVEVFCRA